jgi:hypothetical protein
MGNGGDMGRLEYLLDRGHRCGRFRAGTGFRRAASHSSDELFARARKMHIIVRKMGLGLGAGRQIQG